MAYLSFLLFTLLSSSSYIFSPWEQILVQKAQLAQMIGAKNLLMISYYCQTGNEFEVLGQKKKNVLHRWPSLCGNVVPSLEPFCKMLAEWIQMRRCQYIDHDNINPKGAWFAHIFQGFIGFVCMCFLFICLVGLFLVLLCGFLFVCVLRTFLLVLYYSKVCSRCVTLSVTLVAPHKSSSSRVWSPAMLCPGI